MGTGQNGAIAAKCTTLREKLHEIFNNKFIDVHLAVDEKEFEARLVKSKILSICQHVKAKKTSPFGQRCV